MSYKLASLVGRSTFLAEDSTFVTLNQIFVPRSAFEDGFGVETESKSSGLLRYQIDRSRGKVDLADYK